MSRRSPSSRSTVELRSDSSSDSVCALTFCRKFFCFCTNSALAERILLRRPEPEATLVSDATLLALRVRVERRSGLPPSVRLLLSRLSLRLFWRPWLLLRTANSDDCFVTGLLLRLCLRDARLLPPSVDAGGLWRRLRVRFPLK